MKFKYKSIEEKLGYRKSGRDGLIDYLRKSIESKDKETKKLESK